VEADHWVFIIIAGLVLLVVGMAAWLGGVSWFGHLPGDIRIRRSTVGACLPITSTLLLSAAVILLVYVVRRLLSPITYEVPT
jgi:hypothetical protein